MPILLSPVIGVRFEATLFLFFCFEIGCVARSFAWVVAFVKTAWIIPLSTVGIQLKQLHAFIKILSISARRVPFELRVNFDPTGGFPQEQLNKGFKLNFFQLPC